MAVLPYWIGNISTTSRTGLRVDMQSIGSRSGGLREVYHFPCSWDSLLLR